MTRFKVASLDERQRRLEILATLPRRVVKRLLSGELKNIVHVYKTYSDIESIGRTVTVLTYLFDLMSVRRRRPCLSRAVAKFSKSAV